MCRVLIAGGSGFIGINVIQTLLEAGCTVFSLDIHSLPEQASCFLNSLGRIKQLHVDTLQENDINRLVRHFQPDVIIQASAITPRGEEELTKLGETLDVNCKGTANLLRAAHEWNVKRFIYLGSVAAYGDCCQQKQLIQEKDNCNPTTIYEISKFASERIVLRYATCTGLDAYVIRIGDAFGPWERVTSSRSIMSAPTQIMEKISKGQDVRLPRKGEMGWVYSQDVAASVVALMNANPHYRIYHSSSVWRWSLFDYANLLRDSFGCGRVLLDADHPNITLFSCTDNGMFSMERMLNDIKFRPQYDLEHSADAYRSWWLTQK